MDGDSITGVYRDKKGCFVKGYKASDLPLEYRLKKITSLKDIAKQLDNYIADIINNQPYIYNSWRSIVYNKKGKKIGFSEEWKDFKTFYSDVIPTYKKGLVLSRIDKTKPFSKDNFLWCTRVEAAQMREDTIWVEYNGEKVTLRALSEKYNVSYGAIKQRYRKRELRNFTIDEIVFGRKINVNSKPCKDIREVTTSIRAKASKMISSYKCNDKKKGFTVCDIDTDWMITNILSQKCVYCGDNYRIGCDRIDNNKGHTKDNVVPCCCECNNIRNNFFSFDEMKKIGAVVAEIKANRPHIERDEIDIQKALAKKNIKYKKIYQFNINGELLNEFDSAKDAADCIGSSVKIIQEACRFGYKNSHKLKGYLWSYDKNHVFKS